MRIVIMLFLSMVIGSCNGQNSNRRQIADPITSDTTERIHRSEEEWKAMLTPQQYNILRLKGTDRPYTGKYYKTNEKGTYLCAGCGSELFTSDMKFDSDCGWPSFDKALEGGKVKTAPDFSHGMVRTEILCAKCDGHLGHLFEDGPTPTGLRYCVNSTSLNFIRTEKSPKTGK